VYNANLDVCAMYVSLALKVAQADRFICTSGAGADVWAADALTDKDAHASVSKFMQDDPNASWIFLAMIKPPAAGITSQEVFQRIYPSLLWEAETSDHDPGSSPRVDFAGLPDICRGISFFWRGGVYADHGQTRPFSTYTMPGIGREKAEAIIDRGWDDRTRSTYAQSALLLTPTPTLLLFTPWSRRSTTGHSVIFCLKEQDDVDNVRWPDAVKALRVKPTRYAWQPYYDVSSALEKLAHVIAPVPIYGVEANTPTGIVEEQIKAYISDNRPDTPLMRELATAEAKGFPLTAMIKEVYKHA